VDYLRFLARETHARNMGWGLLNSQMVSDGGARRDAGWGLVHSKAML
jgi:hypothetical protein